MIYEDLFRKISEFAEKSTIELYAVGGFVRDQILGFESKDIDFVVIGDGIEFAKNLNRYLRGNRFAFFKRFETARFSYNDFDLEFVSARKESYKHLSRKPIVEKTNLLTDLSRRDFTINTMAYDLRKNRFMQLIDPFNGKKDLKEKIIRTPGDPDRSFSDDPLRILRAIRFASRLNFRIEEKTFQSMILNKNRLEIISKERIRDEYILMLTSQNSYQAIIMIHKLGLNSTFIAPFKDYSDLSVFDHLPLCKLSYREKLSIAFYLLNLDANSIVSQLKQFKFSNLDITKILYTVDFAKESIRILSSERLNTKDYNYFLFKAGHDYKHLLFLYSMYLQSIGVFVYEDRITDIEELDAKHKYSQLKLALNGKEISYLTGLEKKPLGNLITHLETKILDMELHNSKDKISNYIKSLSSKMLLSFSSDQ